MTNTPTQDAHTLSELARHNQQLTHELHQAERERDEARAEHAELRACANGFALNALQTLREMTGSNNNENPWLGVTAAVALLQSDVDRATQRASDLERRLEYYEQCGDCGEARADIPRCTLCVVEYLPRQAAALDALPMPSSTGHDA